MERERELAFDSNSLRHCLSAAILASEKQNAKRVGERNGERARGAQRSSLGGASRCELCNGFSNELFIKRRPENFFEQN